MKKFLGILSIGYKLYFGLVFFSLLFLLYPIFFVLLLNPKWKRAVIPFKMFWTYALTTLCLLFHKTERKPKEKLEGPYIIIANHSSYLDIPFMYQTARKTPFLFLGKSELLKWPGMGLLFKKYNIPVYRKNRKQAVASINKAKEEIKSGWSIAIFPEGTIPYSAPKMIRFKNGAFKLAIETGTPILPITYLDSWKIFTDPEDTFGYAHPGIVRSVIHDPIETKDLTEEDLVSLRERCFEVINAPLLERHGKIIEDGN